MSTLYEYAKGQYHIHIKLNGTTEAMKVFHAIMEKVDGAWPWGTYKTGGTTRICKKCKGFLLSNPRFAPQDIKSAAEQAKVNVKIYVYSPQENCFTDGNEPKHTEGVPRLDSLVLLQHKPKRITLLGGKIYIGQEGVKSTPEPEKPHLLPPLAPKDSQLVN
jgi:hypothetical protein